MAATSSVVPPRPLAILGGTFDPIHIGHLRVALEASEFLHAELRLLPANVPPHRSQPVASAAQRVAILRAALSGQDRLQIDERELGRSGPSYTIDTLIDLRREVGEERALVLLVGRDAFAGLAQWHRWRELFDFAHIGVLSRPGASREVTGELDDAVASRWIAHDELPNNGAHGNVFELQVSALEVSATALRTLLRSGGDPRYLMPDAVLDDPTLLQPYRDAASDQPIPKS